MGRRGPKPLPSNVHRLRGNPSKLPASQLKDDIQPDIEIPGCPSYLSGEAKAEWRRIAPELEKLGIISQIDRAALAAYCRAWGLWVKAEKAIRKQAQIADAGLDDLLAKIKDADASENRRTLAAEINIIQRGMAGLVQLTPNGMEMISVNLQIANRALEQMHKWAAEFGMTPSARSRISLPENPVSPVGSSKPGASQGWGSI